MSEETRILIERFRNFNSENNLVRKTIMNLFICEYQSPFWKESISIFESLNFPTSVEISGASHRGLAFQILLDISLDEAKIFAENIIDSFPQTPLIVISEVMVNMKPSPIGHWNDDDLVKPGRYFDKLISKGKKGLFVI